MGLKKKGLSYCKKDRLIEISFEKVPSMGQIILIGVLLHVVSWNFVGA